MWGLRAAGGRILDFFWGGVDLCHEMEAQGEAGRG